MHHSHGRTNQKFANFMDGGCSDAAPALVLASGEPSEVKVELTALSDDEVPRQPLKCDASSSSKLRRRKSDKKILDLSTARAKFSKLVRSVCPCAKTGKTLNCFSQFRNEVDVADLAQQFIRLRKLSNADMDSEVICLGTCFKLKQNHNLVAILTTAFICYFPTQLLFPVLVANSHL